MTDAPDQPTEAPSADRWVLLRSHMERGLARPSEVDIVFAEVGRLTAERDDARAALLAAEEREAGIRELLLDIVNCTATIYGDQRHMIQAGKGRQFRATVRKIIAVLAAPERSDLKGGSDV